MAVSEAVHRFDLPEQWSAPPELRAPTGVPLVNFTVLVLTSPEATNGISLAIAELLAEHERFAIWYATEAKAQATDEELMELSVRAGGILADCWTAWLEYTGRRGRWSEADYRKLLTTLVSGRDRYVELRSRR
jgi:hypothetical protein